MIQSGGIMTGISGIDNFINFLFKMANSYLTELRFYLFADAGLNNIVKRIKEKR